MNRREFLRHSAGLAAVSFSARAAESGQSATRPMKAAVIGHTARGNFGHGLDAIFDGVPGVECVALADADATGRAKAQQRTKVPRVYADYREMLDQERPQLVSVSPRWTDQRHAMVKAALEAGPMFIVKNLSCGRSPRPTTCWRSRRGSGEKLPSPIRGGWRRVFSC